MYIAGQIVGIFVTIAAVLSMQFKNMKHVLAMQVLANSLLALNYLLIFLSGQTANLSGVFVAAIAIVQTVTMFVVRLSEEKMSKKTNNVLTASITAVFAIIFIILAIKTYKTPVDILSGLASMAFCFCIVQKKASVCRIFAATNSILWIGYDIGTLAWTTIITHGFSLSSSLIGIIRLDILGKKKQPSVIDNK